MMPSGITPDVLSTGNQLLAPGPSQLFATVATGPAGEQAVIATIRTSSGELTVWLSRDEAVTWRDALDAKIAKMTMLVLPPPGSAGLEGLGGPNGHRR